MKIQRRKIGCVVVFDVSGRIVAGDEVKSLRESIRELLMRGEKDIILNLQDVPYIDSAGIGELVRAFVAIKREQGSLQLLKPTRKVREVLEIVKLTTVFRIFDTEANALAAFNGLQIHPLGLTARAS